MPAIIESDLAKFCVFAEDNLVSALQKISENKTGIVFAVSQRGRLEGVLTDGDVRRILIENLNINLNRPVSEVMNRAYTWGRYDKRKDAESLLSERVRYVPLVDEQNHLVAILHGGQQKIKIGQREIGGLNPSYIIAEIGNNHNGDVCTAKRLIDAAVEAGADCAKFQMRDLETLYANAGNPNDESEDLGSQYTLDILSRFNLSQDKLFELFGYCLEKGITPLCTPWDMKSVEALERWGVKAYKIASADLTNHELLARVAMTGKPIILSTGMSSEAEILEAIELLQKEGSAFTLLHCNSTYPTPFKDVNLSYINRLSEISGVPVGYSGHERGYHVAVAAVARGAKLIEKHITLDRAMEGNDHKVSLLPDELKEMVGEIRDVEASLGQDSARKVTQGEMMNRETLAKSLIAECRVDRGTIITDEMIGVKSPGNGLQPNKRRYLTGRVANRTIEAGDFFHESDLEDDIVGPRDYSFRRPWGIPVRFHDYKAMTEASNPDLLEFHLSYKDLELPVDQFFTAPLDVGLVIHSPELFAGDHIMDLAAKDEGYRQRSIEELQRVIDLTRTLKQFFPKTARPCIIINAGGFTLDRPMSPAERPPLYEKIRQAICQVDTDGVEIIPQTMPPFPWHFGGQRYHNLFVESDEIVAFCRESGHRICLDISHSKLACNYLGASFQDFIQAVGPFSAHLHMVDAEGVDGEGLQIGEGNIDFAALAKDLDGTAPDCSFIPEIWQGHKNQGSGFWQALEKLEKWF